MLQTDWATPDCKGLEVGVAVLGGHLGMGVSRSPENLLFLVRDNLTQDLKCINLPDISNTFIFFNLI